MSKTIEAKLDKETRIADLESCEKKFRKASRAGFAAFLAKGEAVCEAYVYHKKHKYKLAKFEAWCQSCLGITKNEAHMYRKVPKLWSSLSADLQPLADMLALIEIAKKGDHEAVIWRNAYIRELVKGIQDRTEDYPAGRFVPWNTFRWSKWATTRVKAVKSEKEAMQMPCRRMMVSSDVQGVVIAVRVLGLNGKKPTKKASENKAKKALSNCVVTAVE